MKATKDGLKVHPYKMQAIRRLPRTTVLPVVRRVLGMVEYLGEFIQNVSGIPLRKLTAKQTVLEWKEKQEEAFRKVKEAIADTPVLRCYDMNVLVSVQCDTSQTGLNAALPQAGQPVAFAS